MRWAMGTPATLDANKAEVFAAIVLFDDLVARRTRVRSISEADMRRLFSRSLGVVGVVRSVMALVGR